MGDTTYSQVNGWAAASPTPTLTSYHNGRYTSTTGCVTPRAGPSRRNTQSKARLSGTSTASRSTWPEQLRCHDQLNVADVAVSTRP